MKLRVTARANRDITNIADYISAENPFAALRVGERIEATLALLTEAPLIGRRSNRPNVREFPVRGLPFLVIYRATGDAIEVLSIFHTSRDPREK